MAKRVGVITFLVLLFGVAHATHPGSSVGYRLLGFSADGKHAFFEKELSSLMHAEKWLAVYDGATTKLLTSQPVYRDCQPMSGRDPDDPPKKEDAENYRDPCEGRGSPIGKKTGPKVAEKIHAKYGAVLATTKLAAKGTPDEAAAIDPKGTGQVQTFAGTGVEVKVRSKLTSSKLPDPMQGGAATAGFDLEVTLTAGTTTWSAKHRIYVDAKQDMANGNIVRFEGLFTEDVAVASGHKAVALVFCGKPIVLARPASKK